MGNLRNFQMWKRSISLLFFISFAFNLAWAQEKTITGTVTSGEEGPVPGVSILIEGTFQGTATDIDGNFTLSVPDPNAVLVFSSIGFKSQSITVGNRTNIDVVLTPFLTALDEVVVMGYGTQQKKEVTSSVANVTSEEFNKGSVNNPVALIQGKVSGLSISKPGGDPNGG